MSKWQQGYYNGARENWLVAKSVCSPDPGDVVDREVSVMTGSHDESVILGPVTQWVLAIDRPIRIRTGHYHSLETITETDLQTF